MKQFSFTINGNQYDVEIKSVDDNVAEVEVNGFTYSVQTEKALQPVSKTPKLVVSEVIPSTDITPSEQKTSAPSKGGGSIKSPLPGVILDVFVNVGDVVKVGDKICCLEAMKMENIINSDKEGTILSLNISKGKTLMEGDTMVEIG
jgi:glutaconyl-CoA/methylmalonyl-CoA decarboxylase subunit gamma